LHRHQHPVPGRGRGGDRLVPLAQPHLLGRRACHLLEGTLGQELPIAIAPGAHLHIRHLEHILAPGRPDAYVCHLGPLLRLPFMPQGTSYTVSVFDPGRGREPCFLARYARVLVRLPQNRMEHHDRERFLDASMNARPQVSSAHTFSRSQIPPVTAAAIRASPAVTPLPIGASSGRRPVATTRSGSTGSSSGTGPRRSADLSPSRSATASARSSSVARSPGPASPR